MVVVDTAWSGACHMVNNVSFNLSELMKIQQMITTGLVYSNVGVNSSLGRLVLQLAVYYIRT